MTGKSALCSVYLRNIFPPKAQTGKEYNANRSIYSQKTKGFILYRDICAWHFIEIHISVQENGHQCNVIWNCLGEKNLLKEKNTEFSYESIRIAQFNWHYAYVPKGYSKNSSFKWIQITGTTEDEHSCHSSSALLRAAFPRPSPQK